MAKATVVQKAQLPKPTATPSTNTTTKIIQTRAKNLCATIRKDERFHKTEEAIFNALKELMEERPMTVSLRLTELAKRSKIAASTFYRHYQTIDDAIKQREKNLLRRFRFMLKTKMRDDLSLKQSISKIIYFIYQNRETFAIIFCRNNRRPLEYLFLMIKPKICHICHLPKNSDLIFRICLSEIYILIEDWYKESFNPDDISELTDNIVCLLKNARNHLIIVAK